MTQPIIIINVFWSLNSFATITPNTEVLTEEMREMDDI